LYPAVIASEAKQSSFDAEKQKAGLLRRCAPRNDALGRVKIESDLLAARTADVGVAQGSHTVGHP